MQRLSSRYRSGGVAASIVLMAFAGRAEFSLLSTWPNSKSGDVCPDTQLRIDCSEPPLLGEKGRLLVYQSGREIPVEILDLASPGYTNNFGGKLLRYEPFFIEGRSISIHLHANCLTANNNYRVIVESGFLKSKTGEPDKKSGQNSSWTFTTKGFPKKGLTNLIVVADNSGNFCTLQAAVDSVSDDNQTPVRVDIRQGTYDGLVYLTPGKDHIHWVGEDRKRTIICGLNNDRFNSGRMGRALVSVDANDFTAENLTFHNLTAYHGSQAESLRIQGDKCVLKNCDFYSYQDTLLLSGRVYVTNCYIEGDVDFIWGQGIALFDHCELKALHNGYYLQTRNPCGQLGYVFLNCKLTALPDVTKCLLARIETDRFPCSAAAFIDCQMGPHVPSEGWETKGTNTAQLRFEEFHSRDLDGKMLDVSQRIAASKQLSKAEAAALSDLSKVFKEHDGWDPRLP